MATKQETPVQAAKAAKMRAKWARERTERTIERLQVNADALKGVEGKGEERQKNAGAMKEAKSLLAQRQREEKEANAAYEAAKAEAKAPKREEVDLLA